jgi:hypothetical protein
MKGTNSNNKIKKNYMCVHKCIEIWKHEKKKEEKNVLIEN